MGVGKWFTFALSRGTQSTLRPRYTASGLCAQTSVVSDIYLDDLVDCFGCRSLLFVDDLKLWCNIMEHETNPALQADLQKLEEWTQLWQK